MDTKKLDTVSRDAISFLPDEILGDILSLVPMLEAVSTSILSKKWRNVFRLVDDLDFAYSVSLHPENGRPERGERFRDFLNRTQSDSLIKKLILERHVEARDEMTYVGTWISDAVEHGVLEVDVSIITSTCPMFLPDELFTSRTLVKLRPYIFLQLQLTNLLSLSFGSNNKRGWKLLPHLLKNSPKLETLIIQGLDGYAGDVFMPLIKVKVLHILGYRGTVQELKHLETFLGRTKGLELVRLVIAKGVVVDDGKKLQTHKDLTTILGVAASTCKTEVAYNI